MPNQHFYCVQFLSTPSARRATRQGAHGRHALGISIHALREEGDLLCAAAPPPGGISIHALREEGDPCGCVSPATRANISIHALREEGDC